MPSGLYDHVVAVQTCVSTDLDTLYPEIVSFVEPHFPLVTDLGLTEKDEKLSPGDIKTKRQETPVAHRVTPTVAQALVDGETPATDLLRTLDGVRLAYKVSRQYGVNHAFVLIFCLT